jgi:hypothetical protein
MRPRTGTARAILVANRLLDAHHASDSLAAIGQAFIAEADKADLDCPACLSDAVDALLERLGWRADELLQMKPALIRAGVKRKAIGDFERGRIVHVGGWLLGETEVRLCTIAALHHA